MPIYEYTCSQCGKTSDVLQKLNDPAPAKCDFCHAEGTLAKVVSRSSFVLKGGGWYSDLYGSSKKDSGSSGNGEKAAQSAKPDTGKPDAAKPEAPKSDAPKKESSTQAAPATSSSNSSTT
jgi:putative FmdB family regulatory protein